MDYKTECHWCEKIVSKTYLFEMEDRKYTFVCEECINKESNNVNSEWTVDLSYVRHLLEKIEVLKSKLKS